MTFPLYTAMTAGEFHNIHTLPEHPGWMACHFSSYGTGLTNLPRWLPQKAMLIVNDRIPVCGHDTELIHRQLIQLIDRFCIDRILLDFQRADSNQTADIVKKLVQSLPCAVGVTEPYAHGLDCPVFLSPPLHEPLSRTISQWKDRELWLDAALGEESIVVTPAGSRFTSLPLSSPQGDYHQDAKLNCHYRISLEPQRAEFTLFRTASDLAALLSTSADLGFTCAVGLYQELENVNITSG